MNKMSLFVIGLCFLLLFSGCDTLKPYVNLTATNSADICLQKPPEAKSWLCEAAAQQGVTLNSVNDLLLDATAVGVIVAKVDIAKIDKFTAKLQSYLDMASVEKLTYALLIKLMNIDAQDAVVLQSIINRRVGMFTSPEIISDWDIHLLSLAIQTQREQFGLPKLPSA
jgi:hypothetical protein